MPDAVLAVAKRLRNGPAMQHPWALWNSHLWSRVLAANEHEVWAGRPVLGNRHNSRGHTWLAWLPFGRGDLNYAVRFRGACVTPGSPPC